MTVVTSSESRTIRPGSIAVAWPNSAWLFWAVVALYLAGHVAFRLWETPNIGKNDVQEALAAQSWAWGYHPRNPPLHTWLLMGSYALFGVGLLAHVILKYALLGATYAFAYLSAKRILTTPQRAAMAALAVSLLTPFAWTVHTALTHTLLLAAIIFATLWAAIRLTTHRRLIDYAVLGIVIGLGFLAKYSYPLFLLPFAVAMLSQAEHRRVLLHPAMLLTLAVAATVFAPHGLWMATTRFDFVEFLAEKQRGEAGQPYFAAVAAGVGQVTIGTLSVFAPLMMLAGLTLRVSSRVAAPTAWTRVLILTPALGLALLLLDVFVMRATQFEERYFMCAMLLAPLSLFAWLDGRQFVNPARTLAWFGAGILAASMIIFAGLTGRALLYNQSCDRCLEEMPVNELVNRVRTASGFERGTIIADHYDLAGNMRIALPQARAYAANYVVDQPPLVGSGQCLLVWNARRTGDAVPRPLRAYLAERHLTLPAGQPQFVDAPLHRSARMDRLAYWALPNADANCNPR